MVTIDFYNYDRKTYTVNKKLENPVSMSGLFYDRVNIMSPEIRVEYADIFNFNYCYIRELNRYYYVVGFTIEENNVWTVRLSIDVLKTYEQEIMEATATIDARENADKYISNRQTVYDVRPQTERIEFPNNGFDPDGNIIMVTLKGKHDDTNN